MSMTLENLRAWLDALPAPFQPLSREIGAIDAIDAAICERDELRTAYTSASLSRDSWKERAKKAEAELAVLKARIANSVELRVGDPAWSDGTLAEMEGKPVRLLVDEPPAERGEG